MNFGKIILLGIEIKLKYMNFFLFLYKFEDLFDKFVGVNFIFIFLFFLII